MQTLQHRSADLPMEIPATAGSGSTPLAPLDSEHAGAWPLLVLDPGLVPNAGDFLARCRRCGWVSPRQATPKAALTVFAAHSCQEPPA